LSEPRRHGPWTIQSRREVYRDPWVRVARDEVLRPDGQPGSYCVVEVKPGVCVLALDQQRRAHLTEEFHYGVGRVTLECVSGGVEAGEPLLETARRELREELGITAARWDDLGVVDPFTANVVSPTQLYLARELTFGAAAGDPGEPIRPAVLAWEECCEAVMTSRITHGPSCVAILKTRCLLDS
jgi:ADP-ribose pyrophosphatase